MNKKSILGLAIVAISLSASASASVADAGAVMKSFHAALAAGDRAAALASLAPNVVIYESGYVEDSREKYASHHLGDDIAFAKTTTRKVLKHGERIEGNAAIIWEETETTGSFRGKDVHAIGTETAVLEKTGDAWSIAHIHWSSRKAK